MAEVIVFVSVIRATTQLVELAFRILGRLRKAHESLVGVLGHYEEELNIIKAIIGIIEDEDDLQIPIIVEKLVQLQDVQTRLADVLETLDPKARSKVSPVACQLVPGCADEKKLGDIMGELVKVKAMLLLRIHHANIGVSNGEKGFVADTDVINRIHESLKEHIHNCEGLRIAQLLEGRHSSGGGIVSLTIEDLQSLGIKKDSDGSENGTLVDDLAASVYRTERIGRRNTARNQAAQINAPVGTDIWKGVGRLVIEDNLAEDQALQINYASTFEITTELMDRQSKIMVLSRPKRRGVIRKV